jgi:hypothetical protein
MATAFHHRQLPVVDAYMNVYGPRQDYHGAYIAVIMKMLDDRSRRGPTSSAMAARRSISLQWRTARKYLRGQGADHRPLL